MHYVVYIGNSSYFFFFVICSCFSENNRLIFVFLFLFLTLLCIITTTLDKFELQCQKRLSQIDVIVAIRLKFKLYAVFIEWGSWINFSFMRGQDIVNNWDFPSKISRHCHKRLLPKIILTWSTRNVCKNVSSRPTGLFSRFCWNDSPLFTTSRPPAAPLPQLFFQSLLSHTLCSRLERFSTTNNLSNLWCSKFQQVSTYAFCSWNDIFTQKWNCSSPNNLCKCTESPSTLSTNTSKVWNLYLSWSSHLVTSFRLEMNAGHLSKHQNKPSDTDRHKGYFFSRCISQINVYIMKRIFEQGSKL